MQVDGSGQGEGIRPSTCSPHQTLVTGSMADGVTDHHTSPAVPLPTPPAPRPRDLCLRTFLGTGCGLSLQRWGLEADSVKPSCLGSLIPHSVTSHCTAGRSVRSVTTEPLYLPRLRPLAELMGQRQKMSPA